MKYSKEELCLIWLDSFIGLEYKHKKEIYQRIVSSTKIKDAIVSLEDYIVSSVGENAYTLLLSSATGDYLNYVLASLENLGVKALTVYSNGYPEKLLNTDLPPLVLYYKGDISLLIKPSFAIVGTRKATPPSLAFTKEITKSVLNAGMVVVTGTADGVDSTVLKTAIEENKPVISVVAGGFEHIYPQNNVDLIERVSEIGLVISENPPEVKPMPYFFPIRNRIIAGLAEGVLVSAAGVKSGALYTAEYALEFGKDVFAVPYSVGVKTGEGCNELIKKGANLVNKPEDILSFYGYEVNDKQVELVGLEKEIIELLGEEELHVEILAEKLKKQAYEIIPVLQILEIKGYVYKNGTNEYGSIK